MYGVKSWGLHTYGILTHRIRVLPHFVIIGAQKCGTTSLYRYLTQHPCVVYPLRKEVHFFDFNFSKGIAWYRAFFPTRSYINSLSHVQGKDVLTGEATPYYIAHPLAPQRLAETLPTAKLIVMLRNPVDRAYSHYRHEVRYGYETLSFEEAIEREPERLQGEIDRMIREENYYSYNHHRFSYLSRGLYVDQLRVWLRLFPRRQICTIRSEDFLDRPEREFRRVLNFLGLPVWDLQRYPRHNAGDANPMNPATRRKLIEYFQPHNQRLHELLGMDFNWDNSTNGL